MQLAGFLTIELVFILFADRKDILQFPGQSDLWIRQMESFLLSVCDTLLDLVGSTWLVVCNEEQFGQMDAVLHPELLLSLWVMMA